MISYTSEDDCNVEEQDEEQEEDQDEYFIQASSANNFDSGPRQLSVNFRNAEDPSQDNFYTLSSKKDLSYRKIFPHPVVEKRADNLIIISREM